MKFRFFLAVIFSLLAAALAFGQTESKDDAALKSLVKKMTDAQIAYDPGTLDKIYTPDYIEISPLGEFDPREKVLVFYKPEKKPDASKMSVSLEATDFSIRNYGSFAVVIAQFNYSMVMDGKPAPPKKIAGDDRLSKRKRRLEDRLGAIHRNPAAAAKNLIKLSCPSSDCRNQKIKS